MDGRIVSDSGHKHKHRHGKYSFCPKKLLSSVSAVGVFYMPKVTRETTTVLQPMAKKIY